jgi:ATP-dependent Lhr-like helicase
MLLEMGRVPVEGAAVERLLAEEATALMHAAGLK